MSVTLHVHGWQRHKTPTSRGSNTGHTYTGYYYKFNAGRLIDLNMGPLNELTAHAPRPGPFICNPHCGSYWKCAGMLYSVRAALGTCF
ncbi:hypothetical protein GDO86_012241 [Hymenochirus boettgeri]|uniref:Uncharacterized protein n=1 Tax=Hymenochirus boettgeri TaxID=247094 RepID=A0A8T2IUG2_9PIPI|nr:hypothetical protein GDO86_012241 [Hymenochirus boettgeri]